MFDKQRYEIFGSLAKAPGDFFCPRRGVFAAGRGAVGRRVRRRPEGVGAPDAGHRGSGDAAGQKEPRGGWRRTSECGGVRRGVQSGRKQGYEGPQGRGGSQDAAGFENLPVEGGLPLHGARVGPRRGGHAPDTQLASGELRTDVFPVDTWIKKVYRDTLGGSATNRQMRDKLIALYGDLSGYAQQYLFFGKRDRD